jgi:hypothetical protein
MTGEWPKYEPPEKNKDEVDTDMIGDTVHISENGELTLGTKAASIKKQKKDHPKEKKVKVKDPNAPSGMKSAFLYFGPEKRAIFKAQNPDATFAELSKMVGSAWKIATAEEKAPFEVKAAADKIRYMRDMEIYRDMLDEEAAGGGDDNEDDFEVVSSPSKMNQSSKAEKVVVEDDEDEEEEDDTGEEGTPSQEDPKGVPLAKKKPQAGSEKPKTASNLMAPPARSAGTKNSLNNTKKSNTSSAPSSYKPALSKQSFSSKPKAHSASSKFVSPSASPATSPSAGSTKPIKPAKTKFLVPSKAK